MSFIADLREAMLPHSRESSTYCNASDCSKDDSDDNLQELCVNDDMDLDDVRSEDGEYLDLSADNDYLAIVEALMSDMVNKVVNAYIYARSDPDVVVKLRDMIDEDCLQDDFERNKIRRNRRKKLDTRIWQVNQKKKNCSSGKAYLGCKKDKVGGKWSKVFKKGKEKGKTCTSNKCTRECFFRTRYNEKFQRLLEVR